MRSPGIHRKRGGVAGMSCFKQNVTQPGCVAALEVEGLAKHPGLVPTARVRRVQAIVLDLANIEDSLITVRQTLRHAGACTS
jgi:hypothetical protein